MCLNKYVCVIPKKNVRLIFMQRLKDNFLGYIDGWEEVMGRQEFTTTQRKKMCLSQETLEGLRITGKSYELCYIVFHKFNFVL